MISSWWILFVCVFDFASVRPVLYVVETARAEWFDR
jgi:hypothetical protein